jgi:predicted nuclease of predicted toxin-antitoxin system
MNLTPRWVPTFLSAGHDPTHWSEAGPVNASDSAICQYARQHGFALLTNDLDFPRILAHTSDRKPSVILLRGEPLTPEVRGKALIGAIADCITELEYMARS